MKDGSFICILLILVCVSSNLVTFEIVGKLRRFEVVKLEKVSFALEIRGLQFTCASSVLPFINLTEVNDL